MTHLPLPSSWNESPLLRLETSWTSEKVGLKWQERHNIIEVIGGMGIPYSIPKGGLVGEEKCVVMDLAKLWIVQGPKLAKMTCNLVQVFTYPHSYIIVASSNVYHTLIIIAVWYYWHAFQSWGLSCTTNMGHSWTSRVAGCGCMSLWGWVETCAIDYMSF